MKQALILILTIWVVTGIFFVVKSRSRGVFPDILFGLLWPVYWYLDWRRGLWVATARGTIELLLPAIVVIGVSLLAGVA